MSPATPEEADDALAGLLASMGASWEPIAAGYAARLLAAPSGDARARVLDDIRAELEPAVAVIAAAVELISSPAWQDVVEILARVNAAPNN